jgi:hypothetical protein
MASSTFITGKTNTNPYHLSTIIDRLKQDSTDVTDNFNITLFKTQNNNPLCRLTNKCDEINNNTGDNGSGGVITPPTPVVVNFKDTLVAILNDVTFERLYKNIASFPNTIDRTNRKLVTTVYTINTTKKITVLMDRTVRNKIVITITGDTGYIKSLIKTILLDGKNIIDIKYSFGV